MRGVTKLLLAAAFALLLVTGFAACGGESSDDSTGGSPTTSTEQTAPATTPEDQPARTGASAPAGSGSKDSSTSGSGSSGSAQQGSASFRGPGDNSIPNFGEEAGAKEREAASAVALAFMQARARGDWEAACSHLATATLKPLEQLAARSEELRDKDCPELLEALMGKAPASTRANTLRGAVDSLRVESERAFALFHGSDGKDYFLPLVKENGEWKTGALGPSEFPG